MLLLMVIAAIVSVTQLAVIGSWARSLRITTLLQGIAVGFLVCGFGTVAIQFAWTRIAAVVTSTPVYDVQSFASWTVDPFIEETAKVAPLLWLAWRRPRIQRQFGYTDHLLYGAALGMGFELLEAALRHARLGMLAQSMGDRYVVDGGLFGLVTVPSLWKSLTTWQPVPAGVEGLLSSGGSTIQHLVWTALAAVGVAWLTRRTDRLRLLGLVPLLFASLDHANYNMQNHVPDAGWPSAVITWIGGQLHWVLIIAVVAAVAADRIIQARGRQRSPAVLLPAEPATGLGPVPILKSAMAGPPWSTWVSWHFVLSRRAAMTALTAGETDPHLRTGVAETAAELTRAARLPRREASSLWRDAVRRLWDGVDLRALRSPKMIIWAIALLPAVLYLVIGAFPITSGLQELMTSQVGLWLMVAGVIVGSVLTLLQLKPLRTALREVVEPSLHERRLRLQARLGTAVAALAGAVLVITLAVVIRDPSAPMVSTFHVLDAITDALLVLGLALILASFIMYPPLGMIALAGGGYVLVPTATAGSFVITASAGAILASLGYLMNQSSSGGGNSSTGGGGQPPRFTSNTRQSRSYGNSVADIKGQGNRWAERMRRRGFTVSVGKVRYGKYGYADVTVTTIRNGVIKHIRHFIYK